MGSGSSYGKGHIYQWSYMTIFGGMCHGVWGWEEHRLRCPMRFGRVGLILVFGY